MTSGAVFKALCVVLYALMVGVAYGYAQIRTAPHSKTTRLIHPLERIAPGDIAPIDRDALIDRLATREIKAGETITAADVKNTAVIPSLEPALTMTVAVLRPANEGELAGTDFQLCLDGKPVGKVVKPVTTMCNTKNCLIALPIEEAKDFVPAGAAKRVQVVANPRKCDGS